MKVSNHFKVFFCILYCLSFNGTIRSMQPIDQSLILVITVCQNTQESTHFLRNISNQYNAQSLSIALLCTYEDDQSAIAANYQEHFKEITWHTVQKTTVYNSINTIIQNADAHFIMILPSFDILFPTTLEKYLSVFQQFPDIDLVYADCYTTFERFCWDPDIKPYWYPISFAQLSDADFLFNYAGPQYIWRKKVHETVGYFQTDCDCLSLPRFIRNALHNNIAYKKIAGKSGLRYCNYQDERTLSVTADTFATFYTVYRTLHADFFSPIKKEYAQKPMVIIIPSYNNQIWYECNLDSVLHQQYDNYRIIYINDASTDNTAHLVQKYIADHNAQSRITYRENIHRKGALANIYDAVHSCNPDDIILLVDGDDFLAHNHVLSLLNNTYHHTNCWVTYGQFIWFPQLIPGSAHAISSATIVNNSFRESAWAATHLRTFYAGLFTKINKDDLLDEQGNFFPMAWDLAIMFPLLEMAGPHSLFIPEILYVYNTGNVINDHKINKSLQQRLDRSITKKKKYGCLKTLFTDNQEFV